MFVILLRFSANRSRAAELMASHIEWIQRGFDDGVFVLAGTLTPPTGGVIMAHKTSLTELQERVNVDPFVAAKVVTAEVIEIMPTRTDARLNFLSREA